VFALETAAAEADISVIGVTDYMSIEGYARLLEDQKSKNRLPTVDLLIPNLEFRMMPPTDDGKALNLHLLIDPSAADHVDKIRRALKNLKFNYKGESYGCCRNELVEFGRAQNPKLSNDDDAYRFGIGQFKPDRVQIVEWLEKEQWLKDSSLVGISNGKDGISGLPLDGFGAIRDEILSRCHFVFSGNPADRKHYLGQKANIDENEIRRQYRSLKPCVHGSDAHNIEEIFKPAESRFCWIKGDPTFHGLRQILWEPEDRIYIGKVPPQASDKSQIIRRISYLNDPGWFEKSDIELNPALVAIIGEKGSGKTAIADLIAFSAGVSFDPTSQSSFITKGSPHLSGMAVCLEWAGGDETAGTLTSRPYSATRPRVRYLSQDFVERLCSADHEGAELRDAIEEVVYAKLDEVQKEGYSSFAELRKAREARSTIRRESLRGELATHHKEIERLQGSIDQRPTKEKTKEEAEKQIAELKKQLPDATQSADKSVLQLLEVKELLQREIEGEISSLTRRRRAVTGLLEEYSTLRQTAMNQIAELVERLRAEDVEATTTDKLQPVWNTTVDDLLRDAITRIDNAILEKKGSENEPSGTRSLATTQVEIASLRHTLAADEVSRKRILDLQKQISEKRASVDRLSREIQDLNTKVAASLEDKKNRQVELYLKVFEVLKADEATLHELYSPMQEAIEQYGEEMRFSVSVGYQVDSKSWLARSNRFFDGRRAGADGKREEIERFVEKQLSPAWKEGNVENIRDAFLEFIEVVDPESFPTKYGTTKLSTVELYDWMFSVDHIELTYKIEYAGVGLEYLSPGTRGIALLVLYLLMDEDDTRPLLIDQPEGNLDNSSVFKQLVPYIRKAKRRRQIVLITHNPNLVVATDAEQVIIATATRRPEQPYPRIAYHPGSLEHSCKLDEIGTREAVCILLEGGTKAFSVRENLYALQSSIP
jgi:energy-coupling factor transporter ATP-binding protein EcfA2